MSQKPPKRIRLNLEFPPCIREQMLRLQERTNAASITEVLRRAVALYDLVTTEIESGTQIEMKAANGTSNRLRLL